MRWLKRRMMIGIAAALAMVLWAGVPAALAQTSQPSDRPAAISPAIAKDLDLVRQQMDRLTAALGLPDAAQREQLAARLDVLAQQSAELADALPASPAKLEARNLQMRAYNSLAHQAAQAEQTKELGARVHQMRKAAADTRRLDVPGAGALADFWTLQADLLEINDLNPDLDQRQRAAIQRLEAFDAAQSAAPAPAQTAAPVAIQSASKELAGEPDRAVVTQMRLALLRLYDQRGLSDQAAKLADALAPAAAEDAQVKAFLDDWLGYRAVLGRKFDASLKTTDGRTWSSAEQRGKVVLIHFYLDEFAPSTADLPRLREAYDKLKGQGLSILSVRLGSPPPPPDALQDASPVTPVAGAEVAKRQTPALDWPVYQEGTGQVSLRRMFAVRSLPRLVVIDREGRVAAVGGSLAVLEQVQALLKPGAADSGGKTASPKAGEKAPSPKGP